MPQFRILAVLATMAQAAPFFLAAPPVFAQAPDACSLVTNADIGKVTGRELHEDPGSTPLGNGSACTYEYGLAQIVIFSGPDSQSGWEGFLKSFGHEKEERHPVPGVGEWAYSFYPKPRDENENITAFVVSHSGQYTIAASVAAQAGQEAISVEPQAVKLAALVLSKLP
jgi:hypothetical protein